MVVFESKELGETFFDILKNANHNEIVMMDAVTEKNLTFGNLFLGSLRVANKLKDFGLLSGDVVGIVSGNVPEYFVPILACFYQGITVHPLNAAYNTRELKLGYRNSRPKIIFASNETVSKILDLQNQTDYILKVINFDDCNYSEMVVSGESLETVETQNEESAAVILSSSGTTGHPKDVVLTRKNIKSAFIYLQFPYLYFRPDTVMLGIMPFYHIFGFMVTLGSIMAQSMTVILQKFNPKLYCKIVNDFNVASLYIVPSTGVFLAKNPMLDDYDFSSVKDIVCGASPLGVELQTILENKFKCKVRQMYGMTETCGVVTMLPMGVESKIGSAGLLIPGVEARIVDVESDQVVFEHGKMGEICVRSDLNMKEYFENEEATKMARDDKGFIRTGDMGYCDEDGYFFIVERLKDLIKYKGFQVAPAELEDILTSHRDIVDAGVIGIPDERAGELPMAFIVKKEDSDITEDKVKAFVAEHVSANKWLHGGVRFVNEIPKGPTGKILRKHLR
ncbi:PREDICTED: 4-coumarate--CoA ligase 1-like [Nicrophorus vespilloides]|uniref:4-coumarate--CoA ligase 1-like n=1 Tax=Nicrophorus vespilloides TaxID=110193 RepID=A0ABM1N8D5_NICVS|nr:PREDICTED: 4-coumarate--CoA ligase 1-like [Nicrophorus vespilloides]